MEVGVGLPTNLRGTSKDLVLRWAAAAESAYQSPEPKRLAHHGVIVLVGARRLRRRR